MALEAGVRDGCLLMYALCKQVCLVALAMPSSGSSAMSDAGEGSPWAEWRREDRRVRSCVRFGEADGMTPRDFASAKRPAMWRRAS